MSPADAKPSAPDLLIMAADTIGNRAAERDNADGERSMARAVQMFNVWRGPRAEHEEVTAESRRRKGLTRIATVNLGWSEPFNSEQIANARLIASAPDLLEALQEMVAGDAEAIEDAKRLGVPFPDEMLAAYHKARAAIARATGESSHEPR